MKFDQKILAAKEKRHSQLIKIAMAPIIISLLCILVVILLSYNSSENDSVKIVAAVNDKSLPIKPVSSSDIPNEQLRQTYINALSNYENVLKVALDKIDLIKWNKPRSADLASLKNKALAEFTATDYVSAISTMRQLTQLSQATISTSQQKFERAFANAQNSYIADQYDDARLQINQALMFDKTSLEAINLSAKIDKLPAILEQLQKINTAKVENKLNTELRLIRQLLKLAPERAGTTNRKQVLINAINQRNFNRYISQSYNALNQQDSQTAKQHISAAKKIFPKRQEVANATLALQKLEKKQRYEMHQEKAQIAMTADDWSSAKKQLGLALRQQANDKSSQEYLAQATAIIATNSEFERYIKTPYRLSNKTLASTLETKIERAAALSKLSPSLNKNSDTLSGLIQAMSAEVNVEISSDKLTNITVRGVGIVGKTQSKTIKLLPGEYTFEGKRKGFKSKLVTVVIPYGKPHFHIAIHCDEPI